MITFLKTRFLPVVMVLVGLRTFAGDAPQSFAYVLQADALAKSKVRVVEQLAKCDRDWIVLDATLTAATPWMRADLDVLRAARPGRKVVAYVSIGEAEDYRPYWQAEWGKGGRLTTNAPAWLGAENPDWKGNYRVHYWHPEWQRLMLTAIDDVMARGFDGVYLDIVDGFETFEQDGKRFIDNRVNPTTKQSYRRDMVDWVKTIAARARAKHPAALVIPQNAAQLLEHADFREIISAIGIEDLFTNGNKLQAKGDTRYRLEFLARLLGTGKPVLVIEYPTKPELQERARTEARANGFVWLVTDRQLKTLGTSGR